MVKTPGISRYRPEVAELEAARHPGRWAASACGWPRPTGTGCCASPAPRARAAPRRSPGTCCTRWGYRCLVGGNIGQPPWDPAQDGEDHDYWVIETSSYQATDLACSPPVVAVTSLHPDHLDWHGDVETYYRDKLSACSQPGADLTVANGDSDLLRERAALLGPRVEWVRAGDDPGADWMAPLGLLGAHNRRNALIARACLRALGVPQAADEAALAPPPRASRRWRAGSRSSARSAG